MPEPVAPAEPAAPAAPPVAKVAVLLGTLIALTVVASSAVAVALPRVGAELGLGVGDRAWIIAAFTLSFSVATAVFGRIGDLYGLRTPLRIGIILMAAGSVIAATAPSFGVLISGRLLQGAGGGAVPVLVIGIVAARFDGVARGRVIGGLTAVVSIISGSGPLIGGGLTELLGWRAVLALPIVALALMVPVARLAPAHGTGRDRLDVRGALLVMATVSGLSLLLQAPSTRPGPLLLGGFCLLLFGGVLGLVLHVPRRPAGLLPLRVLRDRRVVASSLAAATVLASYLAALFAIPQILDAEVAMSPLQVGVVLLPAAAVGAVAARAAGGLAERIGRFRLAAGLITSSAAGLVVVATTAPSTVGMVAGMALVAVGFGGGQVALLDGVAGGAAPEVRGVAVGVFNLTFFTGGAVGAAAAGGLGDMLGLPTALMLLAILPALGVVAALIAGRVPVPEALQVGSDGVPIEPPPPC